MSYEEYQPASVLLPEDTGLRREFRRPAPSAWMMKNARYDSRTMFYDVFRQEQEPRRVIAIGPPPVNLEPELRGLRISCAGRVLRRRLLLYPHFTVVELTLDRGAASGRELVLDFTFPSFAARVRVPPRAEEMSASPRPEGNGNSLPATGPLAMMTLQKDNEVAWIEDWCRWHRRLHDVTRFHIYDNGSANIGALEKGLRRLGDEMDIALVRWPYPYGPAYSYWNKFTQVGAFNHYRLRFGPRDAWCLLMDVDECLAASGGKSLREILSASRRRGLVSLQVDSFVVPPHPGQGPASQRRVWRHAWRERRLQRRGEKSICIPSRIACNTAHRAWPANRLFERCARWPGVVGIPLLWFCHEWVPERIERLERGDGGWRRAGAWLRRIVPGARRVRFQPPDELFFFHFRGLNTNWKSDQPGEKMVPFRPERHVEDPRIRAFAEQAGLVPDGALPPGAGAPKGEDARGAEGEGACADAREGTRA